MKSVITVISALWLAVIFAFLQYWFWSTLSVNADGAMGRMFVAVVVFLLVGLAPVKLIKVVANLFK
nr:MAG TPA: hypothetical protein [Caudoviricetes sp.]